MKWRALSAETPRSSRPNPPLRRNWAFLLARTLRTAYLTGLSARRVRTLERRLTDSREGRARRTATVAPFRATGGSVREAFGRLTRLGQLGWVSRARRPNGRGARDGRSRPGHGRRPCSSAGTSTCRSARG